MENIREWREELDSLHHQAETSLLIVDVMSGALVCQAVWVCLTVCVCVCASV